MSVRKGRCTNFGYCAKADDETVQERAEGDEFVCENEECRSELSEVRVKSTLPRKWFVAVGLVVVLVVAGLLIPWPGGGDANDGVQPVGGVEEYFERVDRYLNLLADPDLSRQQERQYRQEALALFASEIVEVEVHSESGNYLESLTISDYLSKQELLKRDNATIKDITINTEGKISRIVITETQTN